MRSRTSARALAVVAGIAFTLPAPSQAQEEARAAAPPPATPGEGVWANYDFVPGDELLFYEDYALDEVGDFPRRMDFVRGNWEIVEREGRRLLRASGRGGPAVEIPLPRTLPQRFTIEFDAHLPHGNHQVSVATYSPAAAGGDSRNIEQNFFRVSGPGRSGVGIAAGRQEGVESLTRIHELTQQLVPIRIMVDGRFAKVYVGSDRVANVPNAEFERGESLYLEARGANRNPIYIGPIRVASGGRDLYDDLAEDGRATTRGILFAVDSDRIRPESTPTLEAIGTMLQEHPELRLRIEGHTDSDGEETHNQELSERRAASVKAFLAEKHGIDGARLETAGYGETQPVADNDTPEGKQQNRRVELVRLEAQEPLEAQEEDAARPGEPPRPEPSRSGLALDPYRGLFESTGERTRTFFVTERCGDGALVIGSMRGDVAPWVFDRVTEDEFRAPPISPAGSGLRVRLGSGPGGQPTFTIVSEGWEEFGEFRQTGNLPSEWGECMQLRPGG